ncbi:hypothetical protein PTKU15_22380 [Paraburkholderia terrae]|nr:hypothetical protein PTKU15_22380 [Paraburkholderia terrae]
MRIWPEEEAMTAAIDATIGSLDQEIVLMRILLRRALEEERDAIEAGRTMEVVSRTKRSRPGASQPVTETVWRRIDDRLDRDIDRLIARIASLMITRMEILAGEQK